MGWVYCLTDPRGRSYVGQTKRPLHIRLREHCYDANSAAADRCFLIQRAVRRYGAWDPVRQRIGGFSLTSFYCDDARLNAEEARMIRRLGSMAPRGYNLTPGNKNKKTKQKKTRERAARA